MSEANVPRTPPDSVSRATGRDPEEGRVGTCTDEIREKTMDKTLADSYPASDPPSSIPNPCAEDSNEIDTEAA
jgi:hypothetical protein